MNNNKLTTQFTFAVTSLLLMTSVYAQMSPKETEVWSPEPEMVNPHPVPSDSVVLFDGKDVSQWQHADGSAVKWQVKNGELSTLPGTKSIQTKQAFCDVQIHLEWKTPPYIPGLYAQKQGNSGVFIQGRYELQVLNSVDNPTYVNGQAAAIYKQNPPLVNASLPPMTWQTYDIIYHAPKFNPEGELVKPADITVLHNGVLVQDAFKIKGPTTHKGLPKYQAHGCAPLVLQNHGEKIYYRNIWIRPI
ncbi:multi-domain-containing protein [Catenovulum agarivorans DS-2]|uniref:Multi-domain-containing protein n=1 Tax=Catenovulum agarivorans DS-2 TaxID=1328313 RepID=W7QFQ8_9ALTE|nr:DUF1080 domain-containing protein [Catenovulum agarivorans]EWH11754.1 multi-domain-containing protein [Catenovulum agarivorans DS-2]